MVPEYKRRKYLINKKVQLKYITYVSLLTIFVSLVFTYIIHIQMQNQNKILLEYSKSKRAVISLVSDLEVFDKQETQDFLKEYADSEKTLNTTMSFNNYLPGIILIFVLLILAIIVTWGSFLTHRLVGPIFVMDMIMDQYNRGEEINFQRVLRKKDEFKELYQKFLNTLAIAAKK